MIDVMWVEGLKSVMASVKAGKRQNQQHICRWMKVRNERMKKDLEGLARKNPNNIKKKP